MRTTRSRTAAGPAPESTSSSPTDGAPIWLDLPAPPSVNRTRRIDWSSYPAYARWRDGADKFVHVARCRREDPIRGMTCGGRYELTITLDDAVAADPDNLIKAVCDFLKRAGLIRDDSPRFARRIVIEYGDAPEGLRATLRPLD